jgi:O-antigen/teichoic acid export membrane protein
MILTNMHVFINTMISSRYIDIKKYINDTIFKISIRLILASFSSAILGFIFWAIAARLYSNDDVGIATAVISSLSLIMLFSSFGSESSIIRFFPEKDKSMIMSTFTALIIFSSVIISYIFIVFSSKYSEDLWFISNHSLAFIILAISSALLTLTGIAFSALRKIEYQLAQSIILGIRILLIIPLISLGASGIIGSVGVSIVIALAYSVYHLRKLGIKTKKIDTNFIKDSLNYSFGNYIANLLIAAPNFVLPLIVFSLLGPTETAIFYIIFSISNILFTIPGSIATSLFIEGSYGKPLREVTFKAVRISFVLILCFILILIPLSIIYINIIGSIYKEGFPLLAIFFASSFFVSGCHIYYAIKRIQKDTRRLMILGLLISLTALGLSYPCISVFGIEGVGIAWLIAYCLGCLAIIIMAKCEKWI